MIKNVTLAELNTKVTDFLNEQTLNIVQQNTNVCVVTKNIKKILMKETIF